LNKLYDSDVIQLGFPTATKPIYDDKNKCWIYPQNISIPDGFKIEHIDHRINIIKDNNLQPIDLLKITCTREKIEYGVDHQ